MATPNYGYEKRQKELAKKRKKEDKLKAKSERKTDDAGMEGVSDEQGGGLEPGAEPGGPQIPAQP